MREKKSVDTPPLTRGQKISMAKSMGTERFIERALKIFPDLDYSRVKYVNNTTKVKLSCRNHGDFERAPSKILYRNGGCPKCGIIKRNNSKRVGFDEFLKRAKKVHKGLYTYSSDGYNGIKEDAKIICKEHGEWEANAFAHIDQATGCPVCAGNMKRTSKDFFRIAKDIHGDKYDYSKVAFTGSYEKVTIICKEHGEFEQTAQDHLQDKGCIKCGFNKTGDALRILPKKLAPVVRSLRAGVTMYLKRKGIKMTSSTTLKVRAAIGLEPEEFRNYLEAKFRSGMTWDNHGEWHLDHIVPISSAKNMNDVWKLNHYTNFQPLWAHENQCKGASLDYEI